MTLSRPVVAIMAKRPAVGRTKTRLCPPLTPGQAAALYEALLRDTIALVHAIAGLRLAIACTPATAIAYFRRISPPDTKMVPVECETIGGCLCGALARLLDAGHPLAIALNSDGPSLPHAHLAQAVADLAAGADVAIGPSEDGGYYLIGLNRLYPELFEGIEWSTERVTAQTLARAQALGLRIAILPEWYDVDNASDLDRLQREVQDATHGSLTYTRQFFEALGLVSST